MTDAEKNGVGSSVGSGEGEPKSDWGTGIYIVENLLPSRIRIKGDDENTLILAPLERRDVEGPALVKFDREKMRRGDQLFISDKSKIDQDWSSVPGIAVWVVALYIYFGFQLDNLLFWFGVPALAIVGALMWREKVKKGGTEVQRWAKQAVSLLLVALLAVGVPALVIWYSTGLDDAVAGAGSVAEVLNASSQFLPRLLQLLFIAAASLLPALMYFVFDREQLGTLRDRFVQQVFRLDPSLTRKGDMVAKYGPQIEEMYGATRTSRARLLGGRLSPIVMATLLLTLGWTLTLLNADVLPGPSGEFPMIALFAPDASVVSFAFLGAYFFTIQLVLRSYLRGDLRPKTYGHIAVRILIVIILAWVLQEIVGQQTTWLRAAVFLTGIVPETTLRWIREFVRGHGPGSWAKDDDSNMTEPHPLSRLEGIDLYDLTRLTEEGVTNVEALAHHELVDLMLKTRIPAPRLVDWVDQAILYLHARGDTQSDSDDLWRQLKCYGIRTATDLQQACDARPLEERDKFFSILAKDDGPPFRVQVILDTLADDEWLGYIRHWRSHPHFKTVVDIPAGHSERRGSEPHDRSIEAAGGTAPAKTEASATGDTSPVVLPETTGSLHGQESKE